ncbi:LOW QUALITY PROTEIN: thymocyte nuclear protein 1 [Rhynchocyon petersi]
MHDQESSLVSSLMSPIRQLQPASSKNIRINLMGPSGNYTKTENPDGASAKMENSPQKNSASKDCGKNPSKHCVMKSPESRVYKGVTMKMSNDLKAQPNQTVCWDGVLNYWSHETRRPLDNSNCKEPGIVGLIKLSWLWFHIVKEAYPDHTEFEKNTPYYHPSSKKNLKWSMLAFAA